MATSDTITGSAYYPSGKTNSRYTFVAEWKRNSYSIERNTSNITVSLKIQYTYSTQGAYNLNQKPSVTLKVNTVAQSPSISFIDTRNNKWCTFATWTGDVTHNNDGTLSCPIDASFTHSGSESLGRGSVSGKAEIDTIPRASSLSLSSSSVNVGGTITANITRATSSFTHAVEFYIDSTYYQKYTGVATSQSFTIPASWYNAMSSSSSCTAYCRITTYSGSTQIGSQVAKSFTVSASSTGPSAGTVTVDAVNITTSDGISRDVLVKEKNKVTVTASNFKAGTGSSIDTYRFDVLYGSTTIATITTSSNSASLGPFNQAGSLTFRVTITDKRGQTASNQTSYTCHDYVAPYFTAFDAYRANSDGSANVNGTYLKCTYTQQYSSVGSTNSTKITVNYNDKTSNSTIINLGENNTTYQVYLTITDNYGGSNRSSSITVFGASRVINITPDGTGIAIGKMAEEKELFECRWPAKFNEGCVISDGGATINGAMSINNGVTINNGATINGTLKVGQSTISSSDTVLTSSNVGSYAATSSTLNNYLKLSGGALTGKLTLGENLYHQSSTAGLDCKNSDIINANGIYFGDATDSSGEGINFYRDGSIWDTLYTSDGALKFHSGRSTSGGLSGNTIYNSSNFRRGTCTLYTNKYITTNFSSPMSSIPTVMLTTYSSTEGALPAKIKTVTASGFTAIIGGSAAAANTGVSFMYLAVCG